MTFKSIDTLLADLKSAGYIADRGLATAIYLAAEMQRPLYLEGEAGVGKTEAAKVLAALLEARLIRLQCYEGLDIHHAVYDWNYTRQMLHIRLLEARGEQAQESELFGPEFLIRRPLLEAVEDSRERPVLLLIDEVDRSDEEFEAFLLEILSDYQITIPEIGTIATDQPPYVVITSNRTREVHDALKRRCLYFWIDYPSYEKELAIVRSKRPAAPARLAEQITSFVQALRQQDLYKPPGIAETLDWTAALVALDKQQLDIVAIDDTMGALLKYQDDLIKVRGETAADLLDRSRVTP